MTGHNEQGKDNGGCVCWSGGKRVSGMRACICSYVQVTINRVEQNGNI